MRLLLADHCQLLNEDCATLRFLARGLLDAGHEVLCLTADRSGSSPMGLPTQHMICQEGASFADFGLEAPNFEVADNGGLRFTHLSDFQIAQYREGWRQAIDRSTEDFNPDLIHCLHLWAPAHAALETGVPYVATVVGPEIFWAKNDPRYRRFVEQAAQNAGRILAVNNEARQQLLAQFPDLDDRTLEMPVIAEPSDSGAIRKLLKIYAQVLNERRGGLQPSRN